MRNRERESEGERTMVMVWLRWWEEERRKSDAYGCDGEWGGCEGL